jgi:hypothetical protein
MKGDRVSSYLTRGLDERVPFDSGKETAQKFGIEICFSQCEFYVRKLEREVVRGAAFGMAREDIVGDEPDHDRKGKIEPDRARRRIEGSAEKLLGFASVN